MFNFKCRYLITAKTGDTVGSEIKNNLMILLVDKYLVSFKLTAE